MWKGKNLYFKGWNNTMATLNFVFEKVPPELTKKFVLTGGSAGAFGTYAWADAAWDLIKERNQNV